MHTTENHSTPAPNPRKGHLYVALPDGKWGTRKTDRPYTHVVATRLSRAVLHQEQADHVRTMEARVADYQERLASGTYQEWERESTMRQNLGYAEERLVEHRARLEAMRTDGYLWQVVSWHSTPELAQRKAQGVPVGGRVVEVRVLPVADLSTPAPVEEEPVEAPVAPAPTPEPAEAPVVARSRDQRRQDALRWVGAVQASYARSTGTLSVVVDAEAEPRWLAPEDGGRWATVCDDHSGVCYHTRRLEAEVEARHPEGWCPGCQEGQPIGDPDVLDQEDLATL